MVLEPALISVVAAVLLHRIGERRHSAARRRQRRLQDASFYLGCLVVILAIDSPLDRLATTLFSAHMAQHVLLLSVAPPLIVLAAPWTQMWRPLPLGFRRSTAKAVLRTARARPLRWTARFVTRPLVAWLLFNVNLIAWHTPALYDATLRHQTLHDFEHASFLFTGLLFWGQVMDSAPFRARLEWIERVAYLTTAMLVSWGLAMVLAFAPEPLYPAYASLASRPGGLSALNDQRIAAGVMWVPGSLAFTVAILIFFYRWLDPQPDRRLSVVTARGGPR